MASDATTKPTQPRNLYEALLAFARANQLALESLQASTGNLPLYLTWSETKQEYRAYFGIIK